MSFANSAHAAILGYSEAKVIVEGDQQHCSQNGVKAAAMGFRDVRGNIIKQAAAGSQVSLQVTINNGCDTPDYPATILFEVRDSDGITRYLALQQISLEPDQWPRISVSWVPDKPGDYEVRVFVVTCITCTDVLHPIMTHEISVC
jgi:hypothetical protein